MAKEEKRKFVPLDEQFCYELSTSEVDRQTGLVNAQRRLETAILRQYLDREPTDNDLERLLKQRVFQNDHHFQVLYDSTPIGELYIQEFSNEERDDMLCIVYKFIPYQ